MKHGNGRTAEKYIDDTTSFFIKNRDLAEPTVLQGGSKGFSIKTKITDPNGTVKRIGGFFTEDGKIVTFWDELENMMKLKENLERHYLLKFPSHSIECDKLSDCYANIAELDGYIVGLVKSGKNISIESKNKIFFLIEKLENISDLTPIDQKVKSELLIYLDSLKQLVTL